MSNEQDPLANKGALFCASLLSGLVFGVGLVVSGMTDPKNVTGFLDLFGQWNPYLMFVMGGAIAVHAPLRLVVLRRRAPVFVDSFYPPLATKISRRLVAGAAIFGLGWGLGGVCPGPALVALPSLSGGILLFFFTMTMGWLVAHRFSSPSS